MKSRTIRCVKHLAIEKDSQQQNIFKKEFQNYVTMKQETGEWRRTINQIKNFVINNNNDLALHVSVRSKRIYY